MIKNLEEAGLVEVVIDPLSLSNKCHTIGGKTKKGIIFAVTWAKDRFKNLQQKGEKNLRRI
ncbi:MAG: hypothetical protein KAI71_00165 [Candidatus Pacebacteria bacterium]|nr:hypothetical protein [Candidatus Paceibacterota bacterium]